MEGQGSRERAVYVGRCRIWRFSESDNRITYQKNVEAGLSAAVCGGDMEGDRNTLKTCLLKNAENVCGVTKGPPKRKIPWWWNDEVGKAVTT